MIAGRQVWAAATARANSPWPAPVVFTTGVADAGDHYIVASGEVDLACRITHMPKALFA